MDTRRRRTVLSCLECKRRKLKCDRGSPCSRCMKGGHPETCAYASEGSLHGDERVTSDVRTNGIQIVLEDQKGPAHYAGNPPSKRRRINDEDGSNLGDAGSHSEEYIRYRDNRMVAKRSGRPFNSLINGQREASGENTTRSERMVVRGKNFKTQFFGPSNRISLRTQFPDLWPFMRETMSRVEHDHMKKALKEKTHVSSSNDLMSLLPSRETADQLVKLYIDSFESMHRILHIPSFMKEYYTFWEAPDRESLDFVVLVLLIMAVANCLRAAGTPRLEGHSSSVRETATIWTTACESWVKTQSYKHKDMRRFQIQSLLHLAKQINFVKQKQTWESAGSLLRFGMAAGLHQEPNLLDERTSIFHQEMRRRVWMTIIEIELQASMDRGMAASYGGLHLNRVSPRNINDEDFHEMSELLPASKDLAHYTDSSFQIISHRSLALRQELTSLINGCYPLEFEVVLAYDAEIMQNLDAIPQWNHKPLPSILLRLQLQQYLLLLHRPYAHLHQDDSRFNYSRISCLTTAMSILQQHEDLINSGTFALCMSRDDICDAALSICFSLSKVDLKSQPFSTYHPISSLIEPALTSIQKALSMFENKILRLGIGMRQFFLISTAYGLVRAQVAPESRALELEQAADRVKNMHLKLLPLRSRGERRCADKDIRIPQGQVERFEEPEQVFFGASQLNELAQSLDDFDFANFSSWGADDIWNI